MVAATFDRVRGIAADVLDVGPAALSAESSPETVDNWDSVRHLSLVLALEQQFQLQFEPEEIDGMKNLGAMASAVERKLNGA